MSQPRRQIFVLVNASGDTVGDDGELSGFSMASEAHEFASYLRRITGVATYRVVRYVADDVESDGAKPGGGA